MVTITVNERTKAGKALLETARILAQHSNGIDFDDDKRKQTKLGATPRKRKFSKVEKGLIQGLKEAKEISEGKRKGITIEELLNEK